MALLTIPASPEKGTLQEYSLNVTDLLALISDSYFQDQTNWSKVVVMYQSSESNQLELINFIPDGVSTELSQDIQFSSFARNLFEVHSITVFDQQNGRYIIRASEIPSVASYNVEFTVSPIQAFDFDQRSSATYISFPTPGSVTRLLPDQNQPQNSRFWASQIVDGDFTFTTSIKVPTDPSIQMLIGLNDGIPATADFGVRQAGWGVIVTDSYIRIWDAPGASNFNIVKGNTYSLEIKRTSGTVTYKVDGTLLTASSPFVNTDPMFICGTLQLGAFELSNSLIDTAPYTSPILAGAYGVGTTYQSVQNITSSAQLDGQEGQSFILASPASAFTVKLRLTASVASLPGTIKVILKASDFNGAGAEILSNPVNISSLPLVSQSEPRDIEFTFNSPVSLPAGTNSLKLKIEGFIPNGTDSYIGVKGYAPTVVNGAYYSYGGIIPHVDMWYQVIG